MTDSVLPPPHCPRCRSPMRPSRYPEKLPGDPVVHCDSCGGACFEKDARAYDETLGATRRAAFALVERELRSFFPTVDVQVRSDHVTLISVETARGQTLLDAVDRLREKSE